MRVLLDTHVLIWMMTVPERLGPVATSLVDDEDTELVLSAASTWEIAIKHSIGRMQLPDEPERLMPVVMRESGIDSLPVEHRHALRVARLPLHHRDPFDRLLIAQAQLEEIPIVTADRLFDAYDVEVIAAA